MINLSKDKQNIKCDVHSCKYCDCEENHCDLREIEIKNQSGLATSKKDTICGSYKLDKDKVVEED